MQQDKQFFDIDEMMVDYAEMTSFNFESPEFLEFSGEREIPEEYSQQKYTFKYGNYDLLDMIHSFVSKVNFAKG